MSHIYMPFKCFVLVLKGWGCGYRTLQTICSWVGHVLEIQNHPVPSLQDIQKTLVKMGDKPDSFVGSREWIGCVEACLYMDQTFGVGNYQCLWCFMCGCFALPALLSNVVK